MDFSIVRHRSVNHVIKDLSHVLPKFKISGFFYFQVGFLIDYLMQINAFGGCLRLGRTTVRTSPNIMKRVKHGYSEYALYQADGTDL